MEAQQMTTLLEQNYDIIISHIKPLAGELDLNYYVESDKGAYIAKLMHVHCAVDGIELQADTLLHLNSQDLDFHVPRLIKNKENGKHCSIELAKERRILWLLSYCPGYLYADGSPRTDTLHYSLGQTVASLTKALEGYDHPLKIRTHNWQLSRAMESKPYCSYITGVHKNICEDIFKKFDLDVLEQLNKLPHSIIHNDLNDYNLLVHTQEDKLLVNGLFDFGDMAYQATICETAIALAYAILGQDNPLAVCKSYLEGHVTRFPLQEEELAILFDLIKTRLAVSVAISSKRQTEQAENSYLTISQLPAKNALEKLVKISDDFALCVFRDACGYEVHPGINSIMQELRTGAHAEIIKEIQTSCVLDLSVGSLILGGDPKNLNFDKLNSSIEKEMQDANVQMSIGRYNEARMIYQGNLFGKSDYPATLRRRIHMGFDVFCAAGTQVYAPYDAVVHTMTFNPTPLDYGQLVILAHRTKDDFPFYTLYGHLAKNTEELIKEGQHIKAGEHFANIGDYAENGNWPPHLHLQLMTDLLGLDADFPGVIYADEREIWKKLCPNPALLIDPENLESYNAESDIAKLLERRKEVLGANVSLSYTNPLHIVNGYERFLFNSNAQGYLDLYNNVAHVGHGHPKVVEAVQKQTALLNTNTRYLHDTILRYSEKLLSKFSDDFDVCFIVNSASEANELALRLARAHTNRRDILVNAHAYHGHTTTLIDISPYKHDGPGGQGAPDWVHTTDAPDDYRGKYRRSNINCGKAFAHDLKHTIANKHIAAFIAETYQSVGGQLIPPKDYLRLSYEYVKENGGLNIADEVQTGFGRLGDTWWGFELQNATPDIIVLGKPIANGMPMGAVVTKRAIADSFNNGMEFFSTFGGNPVSCAAAEAVLHVVEEEGLMENAQVLGKELKQYFMELKAKHKLIGDVRAQGFFLGIELVRDYETLEPADREARYIVNRLKEQHILAGVDGPHHNVLKFRPTMITTRQDIEFLMLALGKIFKEQVVQS